MVLWPRGELAETRSGLTQVTQTEQVSEKGVNSGYCAAD